MGQDGMCWNEETYLGAQKKKKLMCEFVVMTWMSMLFRAGGAPLQAEAWVGLTAEHRSQSTCRALHLSYRS
jgi:hypothetical protein